MNKQDPHSPPRPPQNKFSRLNQSVQLIPEEELEARSQAQNNYKKQVKHSLLLRDKVRNKDVRCEFYTYEMNARQLEQSKCGKICRICLNEEEVSKFIFPCECKGSSKYVHEECLKHWIVSSHGIEDVYRNDVIVDVNQVKCEVCNHKFIMRAIFMDQVEIGQLSRVPKSKVYCWVILLTFFSLCITAISLLAITYGYSSVFMLAVMTVIGLIAGFLFLYLTAHFVKAISIDHLYSWVFQSYMPVESERQIGKVFAIPEIPQGSPKNSIKRTSPAVNVQKEQQQNFSGFMIGSNQNIELNKSMQIGPPSLQLGRVISTEADNRRTSIILNMVPMDKSDMSPMQHKRPPFTQSYQQSPKKESMKSPQNKRTSMQMSNIQNNHSDRPYYIPGMVNYDGKHLSNIQSPVFEISELDI